MTENGKQFVVVVCVDIISLLSLLAARNKEREKSKERERGEEFLHPHGPHPSPPLSVCSARITLRCPHNLNT